MPKNRSRVGGADRGARSRAPGPPPRRRAGGGPAGPLRRRRRVSLPDALRGLRPARRRGDGLRRPGADLLDLGAAGDRGRLRLPRGPDGRGRDRTRHRGPGDRPGAPGGVRGSRQAARRRLLLGPRRGADAARLRGGAGTAAPTEAATPPPPDEDRRRPRLVERDAGRREGARGDPAARARADDLHALSRAGLRVGRDRAASDPRVVPEPPALRPAPLPPLPAALPVGRRVLRPLGLRPRRLLLPLRRQGRDRAAGRRPICATATRRCATPTSSSTSTSRPDARACGLSSRPRSRACALGRRDRLAARPATSPTRRRSPSGSPATTAGRRRSATRRWTSSSSGRRDPPGPRGDFLLAVGALVPYKRFEVAIEAARRSGRRLVLVGRRPRGGAAVGARGRLRADPRSPRSRRAARALPRPARSTSSRARRTSGSRPSRRWPAGLRSSRSAAAARATSSGTASTASSTRRTARTPLPRPSAARSAPGSTTLGSGPRRCPFPGSASPPSFAGPSESFCGDSKVHAAHRGPHARLGRGGDARRAGGRVFPALPRRDHPGDPRAFPTSRCTTGSFR